MIPINLEASRKEKSNALSKSLSIKIKLDAVEPTAIGKMSDVASTSTPSDQNDQIQLDDLRKIVWGSAIRLDVFQRWSQGNIPYISSKQHKTKFKRVFSKNLGFEFSEHEPSALVQRQGGPCAVIAPVQAYLIKALSPEIGVTPLNEVSELEK